MNEQPSEIEVRSVHDYHRGYVYGLHKNVEWLRWLASDPKNTGFDPDTMARLIAGAGAMLASAQERLGVEVIS